MSIMEAVRVEIAAHEGYLAKLREIERIAGELYTPPPSALTAPEEPAAVAKPERARSSAPAEEREPKPIKPKAKRAAVATRSAGAANRRAIAEYVRQAAEPVTSRELQEAIGLGQVMVDKHLRALSADGVIIQAAERRENARQFTSPDLQRGRTSPLAAGVAAEQVSPTASNGAAPRSPAVSSRTPAADDGDLVNDDGVPDEDETPVIGVEMAMSSPVRKLVEQDARTPTAPARNGDELNPRERKIFDYLRRSGPAHARGIANVMVVNVHDVGADLRRLVAAGLVTRLEDGLFGVAQVPVA